MNGSNNKLPSGQSWDNMYEHVFTMMEQHLKGKTIGIDEQQEGQMGGGEDLDTCSALPQQQQASNPLFPR
jgi:hypothetical protein